jgi:hypothetical protein
MDIEDIRNPLTDWKPIRHTIIKNQSISEKIHHDGFAVCSISDTNCIDNLRNYFELTHSFKDRSSGTFSSVFSKNIFYRKKIHDELKQLTSSFLNDYLQNFRIVLGVFIVKTPGDKSTFSLHQDATSLNEYQYSPLTAWIPLEDCNEDNGCLWLMPGSHWMLGPFRHMTIPAPYSEIQSLIAEYCVPVPVKAGEVLFFDNRLLHFSANNMSVAPRVAAVVSIFPKEAPLTTCRKIDDTKIELLEHVDEVYCLQNTNFLSGDKERPAGAIFKELKSYRFPVLSEHQFTELCSLYGISKTNLKANIGQNTALIVDPV